MEDALRARSGTADLRLIETLGWDGRTFARLDRHLARLAGSADRLGWHCDAGRVRAALHGAVGDAAVRVRLTLDRAGRMEVGVTPLPPTKPFWRVGLAGAMLRSDDPWLSVKSTRRGAYDAARAALPEGLDEMIFQNERGEVCDGTITTVFFDRGDGLRTPVLSSGLLPGVLRAQLLDERGCSEERLLAKDLANVSLWVGNSLRGLIPAVWVA